jgi:hypothetical protein
LAHSLAGCCLQGGWSASGSCNDVDVACDNLPLASDPGWKLVKDEHGCDVWDNPNIGKCGPDCSYPCCGCPPHDMRISTCRDGGVDGGDGGC